MDIEQGVANTINNPSLPPQWNSYYSSHCTIDGEVTFEARVPQDWRQVHDLEAKSIVVVMERENTITKKVFIRSTIQKSDSVS